jgi:UDP:flavonoid glycosyltransferase YjiC (YdhE family)
MSMARITFVTWAGGGNVPPALAVASELAARGHDVEVMGHDASGDAVTRAGVRFTGFRRARPWDTGRPPRPLPMVRMFGSRAMGEEVLARARERDVDLVVVDCLLFGVMRSLQDAGLRYLAFEHLCDGYLRQAAKGPLGLALRLRGMNALDLVDGAAARLTMTVPELDRGHGAVDHVGPALSATQGHGVEPAVLVSLSTYAYPGMVKVWQRVLDAVDGLGARVVATTGPHIDPSELRIPAGVEVHRWLDHAAVLPEMTMVVGHGGHGTTIAALAHGLPALVLPLDAQTDQPFIGDSLEALGVGRRLAKRAKPGAIRAAIEELAVDGRHREAARRLGETIRRYDGRRGGADVVESLLDRTTWTST